MQLRKPIKSPPTSPLPFHSHSSSSNISKPFNYSIKSILISMAAVLSFTLLSLLLFFSLSSSSSSASSRSLHSHHRNHNTPPTPLPSHDIPSASNSIIAEACKASRDPSTCQVSLSNSNSDTTTIPKAIQSALWVSSQNLNTGRGMVQDVLKAFSGDRNGTTAANNCLELLHYSEYRLNLVADALSSNMKDARAWMSAALVYQYDCWSALKYVNTSSLVGKTMSFLNDSLIASSSDGLSMMLNYDVFGEKTGSWGPPKTERDGFWEPGSGSVSVSRSVGGVPSGLKADVTVCNGGGGEGCDYKTVQEAVNGAPSENGERRFVIWIKAGVYEETVRVPLEKKNVVFLGDGMGKTVITGSMNVGQQGTTTFNSATVGVVGDGFMASNLTIQNTAGPDAHQAVAFRSDSDLSILENCEFIGNQDTLYAHSLRQYYKSCRIQGNVDFIFGNSAAFFQDCLILVAPRQVNPEKGENNAVTAHGRIDPAQSTGFVFQNCLINGTDAYMALYYSKPKVHKNFLGRPWKMYSRVVFIHCTLEALIVPQGWLPWSGDFALWTLYYGEFENTGAGSNTSGRVSWSSKIPDEHVESYSIQNFIQGNQWIPTLSGS